MTLLTLYHTLLSLIGPAWQSRLARYARMAQPDAPFGLCFRTVTVIVVLYISAYHEGALADTVDSLY